MDSNYVLVLSAQVGMLLFFASVAFCAKQLDERYSNLWPEPSAEPVEAKFSEKWPLQGADAAETDANKELGQVEEEDVPDSGRVVLRYVREAKGKFEYWADRSVSYPNLEALARKWVQVFREPDAYVERKRILQEEKEEEKEGAKAKKKPQESVFANLKTYAAPSKQVKLEEANVYCWRGKLREVPTRRTADESEAPKMVRYSDYKKNV